MSVRHNDSARAADREALRKRDNKRRADARAKRTPKQIEAERAKQRATQKARRAAEKVARALRATPVVASAHHLVAVGENDRREHVHRRRADCARLTACEEAWIGDVKRRNDQAACPSGCAGFEPKVFQLRVGIGSTLGAVLW